MAPVHEFGINIGAKELARNRRILEVPNNPSASAAEIQNIFARVDVAVRNSTQIAYVLCKDFSYLEISFRIKHTLYPVS